ncbi:plastidial pyruvate kinase 4, chloroplastic isoform X1 [Phoenix dactylifera]|uniref:pyruvate kinase n=2 Tax=Phoenix dactylifera TaxID=42345 RepID=A0A8B7BZG0_PHODC|nr:plastidial pyruvate kinase 4, chloroplastic isoform X1 [Phoenix dactylifera]XP_026660991.2 plastidial pyruvate kinase 4, chloroplastic isoform X1 [Phoenix dactylifera]
MKLPAVSFHLIVCHGSLPNHAICKVHLADLTSSKPNVQLSPSTLRVPLNNAFSGHYHLRIQGISKEHQRKYIKVFAKLQENDDSESNSRKTYEDMLDAITHKSESDDRSEKSALGSTESSSHVEESSSHVEEVSNCLSFPRQELSQYLFDPEVYLHKLRAVNLHVLASEQWNASSLKTCHRTYLASATNLIHYLALHCLDVDQLKEDLCSVGFLNLEYANTNVLASITASIQLLENLKSDFSCKRTWPTDMRNYLALQEGEKVMDLGTSAMRKRASMHATALFGPLQEKKNVHIMVTVGREALANEMLLSDLLKAGANIVRINCAHDGPSVWSEIIRLAKNSSQMLEKPCRILMDLAGPKLRTGPLKTGPDVMKIAPKRAAQGDVISPAQVWLSRTGCRPPAHLSLDATLFVEGDRFFKELEVGDVLKFIDVRGKRRSLTISKKISVFSCCGYVAESLKTAYLESGTKLCIQRKKGKVSIGEVVNVPAMEHFIRLRVGDLLTITRDPRLSLEEIDGTTYGAPRITCDSGRLFNSVKPGDPIAFDDGRIWGVVKGTSINEIVVSITQASPKGSKLGAEKSINIPNSDMHFEGLTSKDLVDLDFIASNADMVGISFIRKLSDMVIVLQELEKRNLRGLGIVMKIETRGAFENLPLLLLLAMQSPNPLGVMIARGDLAVECGWDQMAGIQEQILSICSAAHVPVIWATQVLESLTKSGIPTRAEITDVASGMRASCIMLNKGKYIVEAVAMLNSILHNCTAKKNVKTLPKPLFPSSC